MCVKCRAEKAKFKIVCPDRKFQGRHNCHKYSNPWRTHNSLQLWYYAPFWTLFSLSLPSPSSSYDRLWCGPLPEWDTSWSWDRLPQLEPDKLQPGPKHGSPMQKDWFNKVTDPVSWGDPTVAFQNCKFLPTILEISIVFHVSFSQINIIHFYKDLATWNNRDALGLTRGGLSRTPSLVRKAGAMCLICHQWLVKNLLRENSNSNCKLLWFKLRKQNTSLYVVDSTPDLSNFRPVIWQWQ